MSTAHGRAIADRSTTALADQLTVGSIVLLPIGATEQHGPHLPVTTDTLLVERLVTQVVADVGEDLDLWQLPTLSVGRSAEHGATAGTLSLSTATLQAVLDDLASSVASWPVTRLVLVNGHGGNTPVLDAACRDLRIAHDLGTFLLRPMASLSPPKRLLDHDHPEVHGGAVETSLMLHTAPDLVDMDRATPGPTTLPDSFEHVRFGGSVAFGWTMADVADGGIVGDPTRADADAGRTMFEHATGRLGEQLTEIARFGPAGPRPEEGR